LPHYALSRLASCVQQAGSCGVLLHPLWGADAYPASLFTDAPLPLLAHAIDAANRKFHATPYPPLPQPSLAHSHYEPGKVSDCEAERREAEPSEGVIEAITARPAAAATVAADIAGIAGRAASSEMAGNGSRTY
jgi:hypothetical protein